MDGVDLLLGRVYHENAEGRVFARSGGLCIGRGLSELDAVILRRSVLPVLVVPNKAHIGHGEPLHVVGRPHAVLDAVQAVRLVAVRMPVEREDVGSVIAVAVHVVVHEIRRGADAAPIQRMVAQDDESVAAGRGRHRIAEPGFLRFGHGLRGPLRGDLGVRRVEADDPQMLRSIVPVAVPGLRRPLAHDGGAVRVVLADHLVQLRLGQRLAVLVVAVAKRIMVAHGAKLRQPSEGLVDVGADLRDMPLPRLDGGGGAAVRIVAQVTGEIQRQHICESLHGLSGVEVAAHDVAVAVELVRVGAGEKHDAVRLDMRLDSRRYRKRLVLDVIGQVLVVDAVAGGDAADLAHELSREGELGAAARLGADGVGNRGELRVGDFVVAHQKLTPCALGRARLVCVIVPVYCVPS